VAQRACCTADHTRPYKQRYLSERLHVLTRLFGYEAENASAWLETRAQPYGFVLGRVAEPMRAQNLRSRKPRLAPISVNNSASRNGSLGGREGRLRGRS
jgi:hypothetical protein